MRQFQYSVRQFYLARQLQYVPQVLYIMMRGYLVVLHA